MASAALLMLLKPLSQDLKPQEALSGIFGSISLATWIFLLVPQLILNYKTGRADGVSIAFLTVWLIGDATNLAGAIWAGLVPTVIAIAVYFCFSDVVLISQCLYYNNINATRARQASTASIEAEQAPLLTRRSSDLPGSQHRRSSVLSADPRRGSVSKSPESENGDGNSWLRNTVSILGVMAAGAAGWAIAWQSGVWQPTPEGSDIVGGTKIAVGAQVLGYFSAVCYLGARIPQIVKNYREKSCEGLALLFFVLSLLGNLTYGIGILCHSLEREYVIANIPWLVGSLGTMAEDAIIFIQFRLYAPKTSTLAVE